MGRDGSDNPLAEPAANCILIRQGADVMCRGSYPVPSPHAAEEAAAAAQGGTAVQRVQFLEDIWPLGDACDKETPEEVANVEEVSKRNRHGDHAVLARV